ncbi:MAG: hypothetical protein ACI9N9_002349 [Enterobacterales bacterium]|jgi:hypothetical protein
MISKITGISASDGATLAIFTAVVNVDVNGNLNNINQL